MVYTYTPAGRLESEVREGQVWYSRYYGYNLDGSRAMVMRDDALNGTHWDMYGYDAADLMLITPRDAMLWQMATENGDPIFARDEEDIQAQLHLLQTLPPISDDERDIDVMRVM